MCIASTIAMTRMACARISAVLGVLFIASAAAHAVDFDEYPQAAELVKEIVSEHGMNEAWVDAIVRDAVFKDDIIEAITRPAEKRFPWYRYKPIFINKTGVDQGVAFWKRNEEALERAQKTYGVDASIIVAIIGVETRYGRITGRYRVIDSLLTIALGYPRRSEFFTKQFVEFLKLCNEEGLNPMIAKGSYAGAMGIPQFISSSYRHYAVDFNNNGQRDLLTETDDAIGSVANYLKKNGWIDNGPIYADLQAASTASMEELSTVKLKGNRTYSELKDSNIDLVFDSELKPAEKLGVVKFEIQPDEFIYRAGFENFYVITTYNRSTLYAMAVAELAQHLAMTRAEK